MSSLFPMDYGSPWSPQRRLTIANSDNQKDMVSSTCYARVGLIGNPSDGFNGKTLSFLLKNFKATVSIKALHGSSRVVIQPHPIFDSSSFGTFDTLVDNTKKNGYYGGVRLIQAACKCFYELILDSKIIDGKELMNRKRGFEISYDTNIPRMVGLSGSSSIILATLRALLSFHGITLNDLGITQQDFPSIVLDVEKKELGIAAGLQDRVIQVYGGLVHMDFSRTPNVYTKLPVSSLPCLYIAYDTDPGGDSGKVHATVKERWIAQEAQLVGGMKILGSYADKAMTCLEYKKYAELGDLMQSNFEMRRELYGDAVVGSKNIRAITVANEHGLAAKFTGSGGALVCLPFQNDQDVISGGKDDNNENSSSGSHGESYSEVNPNIDSNYNSNEGGWLPEEQEELVRVAFAKINFNFVRVISGENDHDDA